MKNFIKKAVVLGMISLSGSAVAQAVEQTPGAKAEVKQPVSFMHPLLKAVGTNLHYGKDNSAVSGNRKPVVSPQFGLAFQGGITPHFSMVSELYYITRGGRLGENNPLTGEAGTLRLYTMEMPVMARFHFGKFHVNAGPSVAYNMGEKVKESESPVKVGFGNADGGLKRFDAGVQVGGGYTFRIKQRKYVFDVRYSQGLTSIAHGDDVYSRYLNISVYQTMPWKKNPLAKR